MNKLITLLIVLSLFLVPSYFSDFYIQFFSKALIISIFTLSLNILVGYVGLVSLGHAVFFGMSGYFFALIFPQYEATNFFVGLITSMLLTTLTAFLIGIFVLRTKSIFFIMSTLAFSQMFFYIFHDAEFSGGSDGIFIYERPLLNFIGNININLDNINNFYFLTLIFFLLTVVFVNYLKNSNFGKILYGIKENEKRMLSLGFHTYSLKLIAFSLSGTIASIAGFLSAIQYGVVNPEMLGWHFSGMALMMVIFGGVSTLLGPVFGSFSFLFLELFLQNFTKYWLLYMGIIVILVALYFPKGVIYYLKQKLRFIN